MGRKNNSKLKELMDEFGVKTMDDVHAFVKMLTAETIQTALDGELENELGYSKYDYKNRQTTAETVTVRKPYRERREKWKYLYPVTAMANLNRSL